MATQLVNVRIDELPDGNIHANDYLAFSDTVTGVTRRVKASVLLPSPITQNFEWVTDNDPGYSLDEVVTYGGKWWQSQINDNLNNVPGVDPAKWLEISQSPSGLVFWAAGVYPQANPTVLFTINSVTRLFFLASATRPYVSSNFQTELNTGDWKEVGGVDIASINIAAAPVICDFKGLSERIFKGSANISSNKTLQFDNAGEATRVFIRINTTVAGIVLNLPNNVKMAYVDWDASAKQLTLSDAGEYELEGTYDGVYWTMKIHGAFA